MGLSDITFNLQWRRFLETSYRSYIVYKVFTLDCNNNRFDFKQETENTGTGDSKRRTEEVNGGDRKNEEFTSSK